MTTPLSGGSKKWQNKAHLTIPENNCHCWDCLRRVGITPDRNSHDSHRRNILPGSPIFNPSNGRATINASVA